jgi:hypothetical protein
MWKKRFDPSKAAETCVEEARRAGGDRLLGATLYGSAAGGEFDPAHSDLNMAFVFSALGAPELEALRAAHAGWARLRLTRPLLLSRDGLMRSLDTFPLEYLLIRERHRNLFGEDLFSGLSIERSALRQEIERTLRGQELGLAWTYIALASTPSGARHWAARSGTSLAATLSGLLHLLGDPIPVTRQDLVERCAARFGIESQALRLLLLRPSETKIRVHAVDRLGSAQTILAKLIGIVEDLDVRSRPS